jgi:hypothetical protein
MQRNPFNSDVAVRHSNLHFAGNGELVPGDTVGDDDAFAREAHRKFREWVMDPDFPCMGAKAAFNDETYAFAVYPELGSNESSAGLCRDLFAFREYKRQNVSLTACSAEMSNNYKLKPIAYEISKPAAKT